MNHSRGCYGEQRAQGIVFCHKEEEFCYERHRTTWNLIIFEAISLDSVVPHCDWLTSHLKTNSALKQQSMPF